MCPCALAAWDVIKDQNIQGDPRGRPPEYVYAVQEYRYHDAYVRGIEDCLSYEYVYAVLSGDKAPLRSMVFSVRSRLLTQALLGYLHEKVRSSIVLVLDGHDGKILATLARLLYRSFGVILLELQRRRQGRSSSGGQRVPAVAAERGRPLALRREAREVTGAEGMRPPARRREAASSTGRPAGASLPGAREPSGARL